MNKSVLYAAFCFALLAGLFGIMIWMDEPKQSIMRYRRVDCAEGLTNYIDLYGRPFCAAKPIK